MLNDDNQRGWFHLETNDFLNIVSFLEQLWFDLMKRLLRGNQYQSHPLLDIVGFVLRWSQWFNQKPGKDSPNNISKEYFITSKSAQLYKKKKSLQQSQSSTYQLESSKVGGQESLKSLAKNLRLARRLPIIVTSPDECEIAHKNQRGSLRISKPRPVESSVGWDRKASRNVEASLQIMEKPKKHPKATRWISNKFTISSWTLWPCQSRASETASRMY